MDDLIFKHKQTLTGHLGAVYGLCQGPQNSIYSVGGEGYMVFWPGDNPENGELIAKSEKALYCCDYLPYNHLLVCGGLDGILYCIDVKSKKVVSSVQSGTSPIYCITHSETHLFSAHGDGHLCLWNQQTLSLEKKWHLSSKALRTILLQNDKLLVGASDGFIYSIDVSDQETSHFFHAHDMSVFSLCISGNKLYTGGRDALLKIWDLSTSFENPHVVKAHLGTINSLCMCDDWLVSGGRDKTLRIWDKDGHLAESKNSFNKGHFHSVNKVICLSDANELVSCSDDKSIKIWEPVQTSIYGQ